MKNSDVFEMSLKSRDADQEGKKSNCGLESKGKYQQIHLTLPPEYKEAFLEYCQQRDIYPSNQLAKWIKRTCMK